nr:uncharacterized protein LOC123275997 isoform X2 [Equus asinus]
MLSPGCSRLRGLARGPALRAHTRLALAPQGPPPDTPVRLCVHRPEAQNQRRAALLGLLGAAAAFARARALASRAPGPGSGRFSPLQFHRDFRASAACLTSRRAQRGSGWSDTCPEGSGHARSSASIPFSRASPSLQALDSLCSFPVEESQGGLIRFGRCTTMDQQNIKEVLKYEKMLLCDGKQHLTESLREKCFRIKELLKRYTEMDSHYECLNGLCP